MEYRHFFGIVVLNLLGKHPEEGLLVHVIILFLVSSRVSMLSMMFLLIYVPTNSVRFSLSTTPSPMHLPLASFYINHSNRCG
jgi:hypothetical protein